MAKSLKFWAMSCLLWVMTISSAQAAPFLFEYRFNVNGTFYGNYFDEPLDTLPSYFDVSGFDFTTGLGTIDIRFFPGVAGNYYISAFFDHEIDEQRNTFFNEYAEVSGTPAPGQTWEVDEPGYEFGDIYDNFFAGTLDNTNAISIAEFPAGEDVSLALAWDFSLLAGEFAVIQFILSETRPTSGFFLTHADPDSEYEFYASSTLDVIPEPSTLVLVVFGLAGLVAWSRCRNVTK